MSHQPVIAIIDVGKTNKKLFLFDEDYNIVHEQSARFAETVDEDGFPCENLDNLRLSVYDSLHAVLNNSQFEIKAVNFSAYGASLVYVDEDGKTLTPLYNYLKPYPAALKKKFYEDYGGEENFSLCTSSPVLESLNSGMQLYRLKYEKPAVFEKIKYALHLPQYLSWLISGFASSDITSIGCHTNLWDFNKNDYHQWVHAEGIDKKLAPIIEVTKTSTAVFNNKQLMTGIGLHDSSAALIPYLVSFREPFVLLSTGTWSISLNPFNHTPLTAEELNQDCLCFLSYEGKPVKASRLFAGQQHEDGIKKIADHFHQDMIKYRDIAFNPAIISDLQKTNRSFFTTELSLYKNDEEAYHQLMLDIIKQQVHSTQLILQGSDVKRLFVDGGFGKNAIYMNLLSIFFPQLEVYAAAMPEATALGAALAIHSSWNSKPLRNDLIELRYYTARQNIPA